MKLPYRMIACLLVSLAPAVGSYAQTEPSASTPPEETIKLPQFTIEAAQNDTSLISNESVSTTAIATDTFNLSSTVKVINRSFLDEINPQAFADVFNYVAGGQSGTLSWTSGRFVFRGFAGDGDFQDGFSIATQSNVDEFIFDRVEIILSSNAFENASSTSGGVPNKITKSPTAYSFAQLSVSYGVFDSGEARLDAGGPITKDKKLQYRVIATQTDYHGYYDYTTFHRTLLAAMLKYQFSPDTQITVKEWGWKTYFPSYNPPPLDPNTYTYWPGLSYKRNVSENSPTNWRKDRIDKTDVLFTSRLSPWAAFRINATDVEDHSARVESIATDWTDQGSIIVPGTGTSSQPGSGEFAASANGTTFIAPWVPGALLPRTNTVQKLYNPDRDLQTDFNFNFHTGPVSHNLLVAGEFVDASGRTWTYQPSGASNTASPIDIYNKTAPTVVTNWNTPSSLTNNLSQTAKAGVMETAGFFKDRILLNYGATRVINTQDVVNNTTSVPTTTTSQYYIYHNFRNYGGVVKPLPWIAVFYNDTQVLGSTSAPNNGVPSPIGISAMREVGARVRLLDNRLNARVSYFSGSATNLSVPSFPFNQAAPTVPIGEVVSHGFDGDASWEVNRNISILVNAADFKAFATGAGTNQTVIQPGLVGPAAYGANGFGITPNASNTLPFKIPVDDVAEKTYSVFGRYTFTDGMLKGLDCAVGVDYQSKRAITNNANQVFFGYVPARTLVNVYADYKLGRHWVFSANIDNVFDTKYIYSSRSVNVIEPGTPINFKGTVTFNY